MTKKADIRKAQTYMKVANHPVISDAQFWAMLPPSARTLEELGRLSNERLRKLIDDGTIHPGMTREEVTALRFGKSKSATTAAQRLKDEARKSRERRRSLPLASDLTLLLRLCVLLGGADCVKAKFNSLSSVEVLPPDKELESAWSSVKQKLAELRSRRKG